MRQVASGGWNLNSAVKSVIVVPFFLFQSYRDFHADVFPDTLAATPSIEVTDWLAKKSAKASVL